MNVVLPGFMETRMTREASGERRAEVLAEHVLGRFNGLAQVAEFVHFLHEHLPHTSGRLFALDSRC